MLLQLFTEKNREVCPELIPLPNQVLSSQLGITGTMHLLAARPKRNTFSYHLPTLV